MKALAFRCETKYWRSTFIIYYNILFRASIWLNVGCFQHEFSLSPVWLGLVMKMFCSLTDKKKLKEEKNSKDSRTNIIQPRSYTLGFCLFCIMTMRVYEYVDPDPVSLKTINRTSPFEQRLITEWSVKEKIWTTEWKFYYQKINSKAIYFLSFSKRDMSISQAESVDCV